MLNDKMLKGVLERPNLEWVLGTTKTTQYRANLHNYRRLQDDVDGRLARSGRIVIPTLTGNSTLRSVTVLDHHNHDGSEVTGTNTFTLLPETNERVVNDAIEIALGIHNERYVLVSPGEIPSVALHTPCSMDVAQSVLSTVQDLLRQEDGVDIAYAEVILYENDRTLVTSIGGDVNYKDSTAYLELGLLSPDGSSFYQVFLDARRADELFLEETIADAAAIIRQKREQGKIEAFTGPVVLVGAAARDFFSGDGGFETPFLYHASMGTHYDKATPMKLADSFASGEIQGDRVTLVSNPSVSHGVGSKIITPLGIVPQRVSLVKDSRLEGLYGGLQFATYLDRRPTGPLGNIIVAPGSVPLTDLVQGDCAIVSDFAAYQIDPLTGDVSTLVAAGVLRRGGKEVPFKGGYCQFKYSDALANMRLSSDEQIKGVYRGPKGIRIENARVSGN